MVQFKVRADSLSEVAGLIGNIITTFDGSFSSVDGVVKGTVGASWVGEDAEKFNEEWATMVTFATSVRTSLATLQTLLIAADAAYTQTESGIRTSFIGGKDAVLNVKKAANPLETKIASGEERAEDMAEFFGRDYAGDDEVEQFGGGMLGRRGGGQHTGGGSGDTDGDGDDDSIGTGVFLSDANREALHGDAAETTGFDANSEGEIVQDGGEAVDYQAEAVDYYRSE